MEKRNQDVRDSHKALLDNLANYGGLWKIKLQMDNELGEQSTTQQLLKHKLMSCNEPQGKLTGYILR